MPKTTVTVFDVAAYILNQYAPIAEKHGPMTAMKLQKLVYYCQAWSLVLDKKSLFGEKIEAWVYGPVVRKLFELNRGRYEIRRLAQGKDDPNKSNSKKLNKEQRETVGLIVKHYGPLKPEDLTELTHQEPPWQKARSRGNLGPSERGNTKIENQDMEEYYSSIS